MLPLASSHIIYITLLHRRLFFHLSWTEAAFLLFGGKKDDLSYIFEMWPSFFCHSLSSFEN